MALPKIQTKVVHSESKRAWNVVGVNLGSKYKIARVPYVVIENSNAISEQEKQDAFEHAVFISNCFNAAYEEEHRQFIPYKPMNIKPEDLPF